jgi:hypothetical protein
VLIVFLVVYYPLFHPDQFSPQIIAVVGLLLTGIYVLLGFKVLEKGGDDNRESFVERQRGLDRSNRQDDFDRDDDRSGTPRHTRPDVPPDRPDAGRNVSD